jgi:hypothetical protein
MAGVLAALAVMPSVASASVSGAVRAFTFTPAFTTAGSDPNVTTDLTLNYSTTGDSVKDVTVTLPPGLLASPAAIPPADLCTPADLQGGNPSCPAASEVATGTATVTIGGVLGPISVGLTGYLMPPPDATKDVAGIAVIASAISGLPGLSSVSTGALDISVVNGGPVGVLKLTNIPNSLDGMSLQINSFDLTVDGHTHTTPKVPFTRLPTKCSLATSQVSVQTYAAASANGAGTSSFTPSPCSTTTPRYTPTLTASVTKDANDSGVRFVTTVSQPLSSPPGSIQAGTATTVLRIPFKVIGPSIGNAAACISSGGCTIGSAVVLSPLLAKPLVGTLSLDPPATSPSLTVTFPPPVAFTFSGVVNIGTGVTTFSHLPDVPLSSLEVIVDGGPNAAFAATCNPSSGVITGTFVGQNGARARSNAPFTVTGCPKVKVGAPTVSDGSLTGVGRGHPKLSFKVTAGTNAPELRSVTLSVPAGIHIVAKGLKKGAWLSGATLKYASVSHGRLLITFGPSVGFTVTIAGKAITASKSLVKKAKRHKLRKLSGSLSATDTSGKSTRLKLSFGKLS